LFPSLIALWSLLSGAAMNPAQSHDPLYYFTSSLLYQCEVLNLADLSYILAQVTRQINDKIFYFYKLCKRSSFFDLFFYNFDETVPNFIRLLWENRILSQADKQNEPCWNRSSGLWLVVRVKKRKTDRICFICTLSFCIRNCSVPSQLRAKIHFKSASPMGFLPSSLCFITVSAASAQTY